MDDGRWGVGDGRWSRLLSPLLFFGFAGALVACIAANRSVRPVDFTRDVWQVRIDVDSAPTRLSTKTPVLGSIDFAAHRYSLDLWSAINHRLPNGAYVTAIEEQPRYRITLGDSASYDEKIVMIGRAVSRDSIVGTWSETIVCCSAGGRFTLWRPRGAATIR